MTSSSAHRLSDGPIDPHRTRHDDAGTPTESTAPEQPLIAPIAWKMDRLARWEMRERAGECSSFVALWNCPVCECPVPRLRRPGRHRVYCSNACRQRAYRLRCAERDRQMMRLVRDPRPERAATRDRAHAIREYRDASSDRRDSIGRGITMCGAFARMAPDTPERFSHTRFYVTDSPGAPTCSRCAELSHSPTLSLAAVVTDVVALADAARRRRTRADAA